MSKYKKQHYVPRLYLKGFAINKKQDRINVYDKSRNKFRKNQQFMNVAAENYFYDFDYVVGDWAYDKLRLKGFYSDDNKKAKDFNKISSLDRYLKENCAYECKYFVAKRNNM